METLSASGSPIIAGGQQTAKRKFFQWAVKWFYANVAEDNLERPDAASLTHLLQSIGFQLREFDRVEDTNEDNKSRPDSETVRVSIECGTSGMRASLELTNVTCKCPDSEDTKSGSLWSISGTGPKEKMKKYEETGSNLLPPLSRETSNILHDVTYHLLNLITDLSQNDDRSSLNLSACKENVAEKISGEAQNGLSANFIRSYTQPEILLPNAAKRKQNWNTRQLGGENSKWSTNLMSEVLEEQPRLLPPKITSSPMLFNQLSGSLSRLSLQSEEDSLSATEYVTRARKNLDMALELMIKKSPNSKNSSINESREFLKPAPLVSNVSGSGSRRQSTSSNSSLRSPTRISRPRLSTIGSLSRESSYGTTKTASTTKSSISSRRSVGAAATLLPPGSVSSLQRQYSNIEHSGSTGSKIPAGRKSFGVAVSQPLKVAATSARNTALSAKRNTIDSSKATNPASTQKTASTINQPPGNLKFGFTRKKSSLV